eukprot:5936709-Amphidinium_carterae.1
MDLVDGRTCLGRWTSTPEIQCHYSYEPHSTVLLRGYTIAVPVQSMVQFMWRWLLQCSLAEYFLVCLRVSRAVCAVDVQSLVGRNASFDIIMHAQFGTVRNFSSRLF